MDPCLAGWPSGRVSLSLSAIDLGGARNSINFRPGIYLGSQQAASAASPLLFFSGVSRPLPSLFEKKRSDRQIKDTGWGMASYLSLNHGQNNVLLEFSTDLPVHSSTNKAEVKLVGPCSDTTCALKPITGAVLIVLSDTKAAKVQIRH